MAVGYALAGLLLGLLLVHLSRTQRCRCRMVETFPTVDAEPLPRDELPPIPPVLTVVRPRLSPEAHPPPPTREP